MKYRQRMQGIYHENLEWKIEKLRQRMHVATLEKGISHTDVLMVSQRLDELINRFYKFAIIQN